uniref:Protein kinase domain-containing protein n=1 Tax=Ananas comosus var. bracteatus TaxID=296719 RepID=A0A6V7NJ13_ANACO|nr:unnamed protein product [Ananas comosus var. bracteatus]
MGCFICSKEKYKNKRKSNDLCEKRLRNLRAFEFKELRDATDGFSRMLKIGKEVKKLNPNGLQGHKEWFAELQFLGVVEHPNLVKLIGYCAVDSERVVQRLLVYEFMSNKTLGDHLFNKAYPSLPWNIRLQIALGAAEGLLYLHEGLDIQVIYRDFKASNVLLDEEFKPKLSDFGLAREGPSAGNTHVSTAVLGTYGYADPDYVETGHLTVKSDVWSFGVVLYEILTGRRSFERNRPPNEQKLLEWVNQYPTDSKRFNRIIDARLEKKYSLRAAREIAMLANCCLSKKARDRPKMREVVEGLKRAMTFEELDGEVETAEEDAPPCSDIERPSDEAVVAKSSTRRMIQLAKLSESADSISKRRFVIMKLAGNPT